MADGSPKVVLNVRVAPSFVERLDILAEKTGLDRPELLRRIIRNGLEDFEKTAMVAENPVGLALFELVKFLETDATDREEMARVVRSIAEKKYASKKSGLSGKVAPA